MIVSVNVFCVLPASKFGAREFQFDTMEIIFLCVKSSSYNKNHNMVRMVRDCLSLSYIHRHKHKRADENCWLPIHMKLQKCIGRHFIVVNGGNVGDVLCDASQMSEPLQAVCID